MLLCSQSRKTEIKGITIPPGSTDNHNCCYCQVNSQTAVTHSPRATSIVTTEMFSMLRTGSLGPGEQTWLNEVNN